jgi:hypothetical protein
MRNTHAMVFLVFLAGASVLAPACAKRGPDASTASSQARVVVANQTGAPLALHVAATDQATGDVALNDTITVQQGDVHVLAALVPPSAYMFSAELLGDAAGRAFPSTGGARVTLVEGATTEVRITGLPAANGGGSTLRIGVGDVPAIDGVKVVLEGGPQGTLKVDVHASTRAVDGLTLFWSGAGLSGTVKGSSTLILPAASFAAAAAPTGSVVLHVVVQDASGLANSVDVLLVTSDTGPRGSIVASSGGDQGSACLAAQVKCAASCDAGLGAAVVTGGDTACQGACGVGFAACLGH